MPDPIPIPIAEDTPDGGVSSRSGFDVQTFPWWLLGMGAIIGWMALSVVFSEAYQEALVEILPGLKLTLLLTVGAFVVSMVLGVLIGLARVSKNVAFSSAAQVYIELIRGIPMLVFIFLIAFVLAPWFVDLFNWVFGTDHRTRDLAPNAWRGGVALSLFYAAFIAEVVRAGVQSVPKGQIEAGMALGLRRRTVLRQVTLPQAFRNTFPALGNDLISLMKDTSLVSVIAAAEMTYEARIYQGSSFRVRETFFILAVLYVILTLLLSLALRTIESHIQIPGTDH
ncbi:MAG: amino acid ABC transporter permease [Actinomycetia bacterium]|nr:amino acid ABC transporter permease [Actinomycetes bacterium]